MISVVQFGVGPLGRHVLKFLLERQGIAVAGVVDPDPALVGRDVHELAGIGAGELVAADGTGEAGAGGAGAGGSVTAAGGNGEAGAGGAGATGGVRVSASLDEALSGLSEQPRVAVLTTVSSIERLVDQVRVAAEAGMHVVSTCEELLYPWKQHPEAAQRIDQICREHDVACLGTGVNPGFLMDYLPVVFTSTSRVVERVTVERVQDASTRRIPFQKKIGAGLTPEQFEEHRRNGILRHVGLPESVDLIAAAMGWELDENIETLEPVLSETGTQAGYKPIDKGMPAGVQQVGSGMVNGKEVIRLVFRAAVGEPQSYDRIEVKGEPNVLTEIKGGLHGDVATSAITVNAVKAVVRAEPGLRTMLDIPVPAWFA